MTSRVMDYINKNPLIFYEQRFFEEDGISTYYFQFPGAIETRYPITFTTLVGDRILVADMEMEKLLIFASEDDFIANFGGEEIPPVEVFSYNEPPEYLKDITEGLIRKLREGYTRQD